MTRQPALEKRITVAWPMPRLAPVRSSVRRGALVDDGINSSLSSSCPGLSRASTSSLPIATRKDVDGRDKPGHDGFLRIHPHLAPGLARRVAAEFDAVVQAEWTIVPELHSQGRDAPAAPARWPRH